MYKTNSPVLFLVFNRPLTTQKVFDAIKKVCPTKLYIASDGPRLGNFEDVEKCNQVKQICSEIDWKCEVKTLYRDVNLGCKYAISSSIDWFFENEEQGIILEDDCLPCDDFFKFCDLMLPLYKNDTRIRFIAGSNFQNGNRNKESYYFSNLSHVWGWAGWRRVWNSYDVELSSYKDIDALQAFKTIFNNSFLAEDWKNIIESLLQSKINTWDYQLAITNMFNNGLSIMPSVNLISNIGFGKDATHTFENNGFDSLPFGKLDDVIIHPSLFLPDKKADLNTLTIEHNLIDRVNRERKKERFKFWKRKDN